MKNWKFRWQLYPKLHILPWSNYLEDDDGRSDLIFGWLFWQFWIMRWTGTERK